MKKVLLLLLAMTLLFAACAPSVKEEEFTKEDFSIEEDFAVEVPEPEPEPEVEVELPEPTDIYADFDVQVNADNSFTITTNLPDETDLGLTLKGRGYMGQARAYVKDGVAKSECFTDRGETLRGDFELEVMMPIPNVQTDYVKHFIGSRGEFLKGKYVEGALGSVVVRKTFKVKLPGTGSGTDSSDAASGESEENGKYYRTKTGTKYHLDRDCAGKTSYKSDDIDGLDACKKCIKQ